MALMGNKLKSSGKYRTETLKFANVIPDKTVWDALEHTPADRVFSRCGVVKFVIDLDSDPEKPKPYFLQSKIYTYHYEFVQDQLGIPVELSTFNDEQYLFWPRRFMLGTIVNYKDQGIIAFELWPGDTMPANGIVDCWKLLSSSIMPGQIDLRFRACGATHEKVLRDELSNPKVEGEYRQDLEKMVGEAMVKSEDLFKAVTYQPLTIGTAVGTLRILRNVNADPSQLLGLSREDILVCDDIPNDLPPVRALVTSQLQTPLCHVALLCSNRRAPNLAVRSALIDFAPFEGKFVKLSCNMLDFQIAVATEADKLEWLKTPQGQRASQPSLIVPLDCNDDITEIISISSLKRTADIAHVEHAIGAKASQIARLAKVDIPEACFTVIRPSFVIPFSHYKKHIDQSFPTKNGEKHRLEQLIEASQSMATRELANDLGQIQERLIESEHFDKTLLDAVMKKIENGLGPGGFLENAGGAIFRSSTNVEDLPGFNGAGLYLSEPIKTADLRNRDVVAETIKRVWASVWTVRGFMERSEFGLDQKSVRMAILVMPFLDASRVICNGVAITGNPFRNTFNAHFINAQVAGHAVTDNCNGTTAEQILVYDDDTPTPETVSTSSLTQGKAILQPDEIINSLFPTFRTLHKKFASKKREANVGHAVDIEFLILDNPKRDLVLLQCRPTTIAYQKS